MDIDTHEHIFMQIYRYKLTIRTTDLCTFFPRLADSTWHVLHVYEALTHCSYTYLKSVQALLYLSPSIKYR